MKQFTFKNNIDIDLNSLEIMSERLQLTAINHEYADTIYQEFRPPVTRYMMPKPADNIEETINFIQRSLDSMSSRNEIILVILDASSKEFLGCCGFHGRENSQTPELGIWLKIGAHGYGYGIEAIVTLCRWAIQHILFDYAIYPVDKRNLPSRRIPESLGGNIYREAIVETMSGSQLDEVIFKLPRQELLARLV